MNKDMLSPLATFRLEKKAGEYKDFHVHDKSYPLKGVTYPVNYGDISGYTGEDGANLDVFFGEEGDLYGFIKVYRSELKDGEHKFYVYLTNDEEENLLKEFYPVLLEHRRFSTIDELIAAMEPFKDAN